MKDILAKAQWFLFRKGSWVFTTALLTVTISGMYFYANRIESFAPIAWAFAKACGSILLLRYIDTFLYKHVDSDDEIKNNRIAYPIILLAYAIVILSAFNNI